MRWPVLTVTGANGATGKVPLVARVSGSFIETIGVPRGFRIVDRIWEYDAFWCAHWSIAPIVRAAFWLYNRRYAGHKLLVRLGFLDGELGYTYRAYRWRWDFWNGSHSWVARRYARRHGWRAHGTRYGAR